MKQTLSKALRPRRLSELIGADKLVRAIHKQYESGREPNWMFVGESGTGKTSISRIIANSLQCIHQEKFGETCDDCLKNRRKFDIEEINASSATGIQELKELTSGAYLTPKHGSRRRCYILDEAQRMSASSQNFLLKLCEDGSADTTVFFICTTEPEKILKTLRRRFIVKTVPPLDGEYVEILVKRALQFTHSKLPAEPLVDALIISNLTSHGLVLKAVENYLAGDNAEDAVKVDLSSFFDSGVLITGMRKGDWETVRKQLKGIDNEDARSIKASVSGYLNSMLVGSESMGTRTMAISKAIEKMNFYADDSNYKAMVARSLFDITKLFSKYR